MGHPGRLIPRHGIQRYNRSCRLAALWFSTWSRGVSKCRHSWAKLCVARWKQRRTLASNSKRSAADWRGSNLPPRERTWPPARASPWSSGGRVEIFTTEDTEDHRVMRFTDSNFLRVLRVLGAEHSGLTRRKSA